MNKISNCRTAKERVAPSEGWVLYDGRCGFCSRWVPFLKDTLKRRGFAVAPLQSEWVAEKLRLPPGELTADVRLLLVNDRQLRGPEVYRYVMRRIWWAMPLYFLSVLPILRGLFDAGYRAFAARRYCISEYCGLPGMDKANFIGADQRSPRDGKQSRHEA
jgi:predicted DCC family thiol-disulfide oxidoreductase YuxK